MGLFDELDDAFGRMLVSRSAANEAPETTGPVAEPDDQDVLAVDADIEADVRALKSALASESLVAVAILAHHLSASGRKYWLSALHGALSYHRRAEIDLERRALVDQLLGLLITGSGRVRKILRGDEPDRLRRMAISLGGVCDHNQFQETRRLVTTLILTPSLTAEDTRALFTAGIYHTGQVATATLVELHAMTQIPEVRLFALRVALSAR